MKKKRILEEIETLDSSLAVAYEMFDMSFLRNLDSRGYETINNIRSIVFSVQDELKVLSQKIAK